MLDGDIGMAGYGAKYAPNPPYNDSRKIAYRFWKCTYG